MLDDLDGVEYRGCFLQFFLFPGKFILWFKYMFPKYGKLWRSKRQANSPTMTFFVSSIFWIAFAFFALVSLMPKPNIGNTNNNNLNNNFSTKHDNTGLNNSSEDILVAAQSINKNHLSDAIWSEQNLDVITYRNGDTIEHAQSEEEWKAAIENRIGAWCYYNNDTDKGILYNKFAVNDNRGLAPAGSHIPTATEWNDLIISNNLSFISNCKGGMRKSNGGFKKLNKIAYFWVSLMNGENKNMALDLSDLKIVREGNVISNTGEGFSVRCIKD
jgi:hypothetical protein